MEKKQVYMVRQNGKPNLLRISPSEEHSAFVYSMDTGPYITWVYTPELDDILTHREKYPEYIEVSDEDAEEIMKALDEEHDRMEKEKNIIHSKHRQKHMAAGVVNIETYYKSQERRAFQDEELEMLLSGLVKDDRVIIQEMNYSCFDYWGYEKLYSSMDKNDISDVCGNPLKIDAYFMDDERKYRFRYRFRDEIVEVASCRKDMNIDLRSVFDDDDDIAEEEYPGIPRAEFDEAVALFLENPHWREYYETAPGEACREYIAMEFYHSEHETPEAEEVLNQMEEDLGLADWKHLLKYCGNNPRKGFIMKRIEGLTGEA